MRAKSRNVLSLPLALCAGLSVSWQGLVASAAEPTITDAAPAESLLVATVRDWTTMKAAFDRTGFKALWSSAEVQALVAEIAEEFASEFEDSLTAAGIEKDDIVYPTGSIGVAMFLTEPLDTVESRIATMEGEMRVGVLAMADFGENADKFGELLEKFYDNQSEKFGSEIKQTAHGELTITSMIPKPADGDEVEEAEWDAPGTDLLMPFENDDEAASFHIVRTGTTFMFADTIEVLHESIDRALDPTRPSVAEDARYIRSLAQHPADVAASVVFGVGPVVRLAAAAMTAEQRSFDETAPDMSVVLDAAGVMGVETASFGVRLDTPDAMLETTLGVLAPEKKGLLAMFRGGAPTFRTPAFVPSDAANVWQLVVDFKQVPQLVASVIESLPEPVRDQASAGYGQARPIVQSVIDALGSEIFFAQTIAQPLSATSQKMIVGIGITDALVFGNLATTYGPMAQMTARDFQGSQMFVQEDAGIAIGLAADWMFVGGTSEVEDALRRGAAPGDDLLSGQENFKRAVRSLEGDAVTYSFANMEKSVRYALWSVQNAAQIADEQMAAFGMDEESRRQMREAMEADQPDWIRLLPPAELVLRHIGDTVGELRPTPDGFRGRTLFLRPAE